MTDHQRPEALRAQFEQHMLDIDDAQTQVAQKLATRADQ